MAEGIATRSSRGHRTICVPIEEEDYLRIIHDRVHVSFCACRWRGEIVNGGIPDSLVMWDGFGALESGICPGGTGSWMGRRPC